MGFHLDRRIAQNRAPRGHIGQHFRRATGDNVTANRQVVAHPALPAKDHAIPDFCGPSDADLRREYDKLEVAPDPQRVHDEVKRLLDFREYINTQMIAPAVEAREQTGKDAFQAAVEM